jgi:two-component system, LuxR family, sensor kinase FixL
MGEIDHSRAGGDRTLIAADEEIAHLWKALAEREHELAELRELGVREHRLRLLLEYSQRLFFIAHFDLSKVYYVSSGYEVIYGRSRESLYAHPMAWFEATHPDDRQLLIEALERRRLEGAEGVPPDPDAPLYLDYRIIRPDGEVRWVRGRSFVVPEDPSLIFGVAEDVTVSRGYEEELRRQRDELEVLIEERRREISRVTGWYAREATERQRAEQSLRESEKLYRLLAVHSTDMITQHTKDGVYIYVSPACRDLLGYEPDELVGRNLYELFHPDDIPLVRDSHEQLSMQPTINTISYRIRRGDGAYTWLETSTKMIHDPETGEFQSMIGVSRDVSKRKEAEARAALLQQQLEHAARVRGLGEMTSGLAHELNQPLTAVGNYIETCRNLLAGRRGVPAMAHAALAEAAAEAQRAGKVIQHLRTFLRPSPADQVLSDLNELVGQVLELCGADLRLAEVGLELSLDRALPPILIDPVQVQHVILNLVRNAVESMARTADRRRLLTIQTGQRPAGAVELTVVDTGPGIAVGEVEKLFEPFYTTKQGGLGLGLAISRTIVETHGGRMTARAIESGGMAFSFSMPVSAAGSGANGGRGGA